MNLPFALSLGRIGLVRNGENTEVFNMEGTMEKESDKGTECERDKSYSNRDASSIQDTVTNEAFVDKMTNFNSEMAVLAMRANLLGLNLLSNNKSNTSDGNMLHLSPLSLYGLTSGGEVNYSGALPTGYGNVASNDNFDRLFSYPGNTIMLNSEISLRRLDDNEVGDSGENNQINSLTSTGQEIESSPSHPMLLSTDIVNSTNSRYTKEPFVSANVNQSVQNFIQVNQCINKLQNVEAQCSINNITSNRKNEADIYSEKNREKKDENYFRNNAIYDSPLQLGEISHALDNENLMPPKLFQLSNIANVTSQSPSSYPVITTTINPPVNSTSNSCGSVTEGEIADKVISAISNSISEKLPSSSGRKFVCSLCGKKYHSEEMLMQHEVLHSGKKNFPCPVCGKEFSREHSMLTHKRIHTEEKNFKCDLCGKGFYWKSCLRRHMDVHIDDKDFTCPICGKVFVNKSYVAGHMAVHTGEKKFKCEICGKGFSFKVSLRKHRLLHTQEHLKIPLCRKEPFLQSDLINFHQDAVSTELGAEEKTLPSQSCDDTSGNLADSNQCSISSVCDKIQTTPKDSEEPKNVQADLPISSKSAEENQKDIVDIPGDPAVISDISKDTGKQSSSVHSLVNLPALCGTNTKANSGAISSLPSTVSESLSMDTNISVLQGNAVQVNESVAFDSNRKYGCDVCGKRFHSKANLLRHETIHSGKKNFPCGVCGKEFSREYNLINHRRIHTAEKNYKCDLCNKEFYWKSCLTRHMGVHIDEKDFTCPICGKVFFNKSYVTGHMVVHTGEKKFKCDICGKGFSFKVSLNKHKIIHTNEKNIKCDICGKKFFQKSNLNLHRAVHTNKKKFVCEFCGKIFSSKVYLDDHVALHTGEFKCTVCDENFSSSVPLTEHMAVHKGTKDSPKHKCDLCGKTFNKKSNLILHKVVHAGKKDFSCDICGKSYYHKFNLVQHMVIHTETIKCNVCGKVFARQAQLNRHMAIHTVLMNRQAGEIFPSVPPISRSAEGVSAATYSQKENGVNLLSQKTQPAEKDPVNPFMDENRLVDSIPPTNASEDSEQSENANNSRVGGKIPTNNLSEFIFTVETMLSDESSDGSFVDEKDIDDTIDDKEQIGNVPLAMLAENAATSLVGAESLSDGIYTTEERSEENEPAETILDGTTSKAAGLTKGFSDCDSASPSGERVLVEETEPERKSAFETDIPVNNIKVETFKTEPLESDLFLEELFQEEVKAENVDVYIKEEVIV
ncbi:LOW QUALITY PROTEIN: zinc finger protein 160-like [Palaemon carinicauda]|uniref:LOW QUALITY PROTEIN: zinc finger protein 160-like n=1 Tax=Palaemon carinicauda TaxID=392227 RepID=UPI0035B68735